MKFYSNKNKMLFGTCKSFKSHSCGVHTNNTQHYVLLYILFINHYVFFNLKRPFAIALCNEKGEEIVAKIMTERHTFNSLTALKCLRTRKSVFN